MDTLYITDLDGTLLDSGARLSEKSAEILTRLLGQGLSFTCATARSWATGSKILSALPLNLPVILMNGVLLFDSRTGKYIDRETIPQGSCHEIISLMRKFSVSGFVYRLVGSDMYSMHEGLSNDFMRDFYTARRDNYYKSFVEISDLSAEIDDNVIYFTLLDTEERLRGIFRAVQSIKGILSVLYKCTYTEGLWYLEIFSEKASKERAVEKLRRLYSPRRIVLFGDNYNDMSLFSAAGEGDLRVAVGNAVDELKSAADIVCGDNDCDAVARFIEEDFIKNM